MQVKGSLISERKIMFSKSPFEGMGFSSAFSATSYLKHTEREINPPARSQCIQRTELLLCNTTTVINLFRVTGRS